MSDRLSHPTQDELFDVAHGLTEPSESLSKHVDGCPRCQAELRQMIADRELARATRPDGLEAIDATSGREARPSLSRSWGYGLAAALVLLALLAWWRPQHPEPQELPTTYAIPLSDSQRVLRQSVGPRRNITDDAFRRDRRLPPGSLPHRSRKARRARPGAADHLLRDGRSVGGERIVQFRALRAGTR